MLILIGTTTDIAQSCTYFNAGVNHSISINVPKMAFFLNEITTNLLLLEVA